jgi:tetratricopeptide (TPR) repeat protein
MYDHRRSIYWALFGLFFFFESIHFFPHVFPEGGLASLLLPLGHLAPVALALLLLFLIKVTEREKEELDESLAKAPDVIDKLASESRRVGELTERVEQIANATKTLADQLRSSDTMLHGKLLFFQQKYDQAAEIFAEAVVANPEDPEANRWAGLSHLRDGNPRYALRYLEKAARDSDAESLRILGEAEHKLRRYEDAERHLAAAIAGGTKNQEDTKMLLAQVRLQTDVDAGIATLREIVDANPMNGNAVSMLAGAYTDEGQYTEALSVCDRALNLKPRNWGVLAARAEVRIRRGLDEDWSLADQDLEAIRVGNPQDFNLYRLQGGLLTERARRADELSEKSTFLHKAAAVYREGISRMKEGWQGPLYASLSFVQLLSGDLSDAEESASLAVQRYPGAINHHMALCGALAANARWSALQRAARNARDVGGRLGRIFSYAYEVLGGLCAGDRITDMRGECRELAAELRNMPQFNWRRADWQSVRNRLCERLGGLSGQEQILGETLLAFIDGKRQISVCVAQLEGL